MSGAFEFGENWRAYLEGLGSEHIAQAREALTRLLGSESLQGRTFLDIGCGNGPLAISGGTATLSGSLAATTASVQNGTFQFFGGIPKKACTTI